MTEPTKESLQAKGITVGGLEEAIKGCQHALRDYMPGSGERALCKRRVAFLLQCRRKLLGTENAV